MSRRQQRVAQPTIAGNWSRVGAICFLGGALGSIGLASAQQVAGRGLSVGGSVDVSVTASADERGAGQKSSDTETQLRPAVYLTSRTGRVVGQLSYALVLIRHSNEYVGQNIHNQLNASFSAEAIERWAYVDVAATVAQQPASAYGQQTAADSGRDNPNLVEVGTLNISPYVRGVLGAAVNYDVRLTASGTNGRRSKTADSTTMGGNVSLSSVVPGAMVGWGLSASQVTQDYRVGRESRSDRYSASLTFMPDPDLTLNLRGGQESNDIASLSSASYNNWGVGLTWRPSPRTRAQVQFDERYFGKAHQVVLEHRLAATSFQFISSRDAGGGADMSAGGQPITLYQALDRLLTPQYPDPVERDVQIRLRLGNADPGQLVGGGAINSAVTVTQRQQLVASYAAARLSGSLQIYTTSSKTADVTAAAAEVEQWGYLGTLGYRLTPTASVNLTGSRMVTQGTDSNPGNELKSATFSWTEQVAKRTTAAVSLRYSVFNSALAPYREGALTASLSQRF